MGTTGTDSCARALMTAVPGAVLLPNSPDYAGAMGRLFSTEASLTSPTCIVQPRNAADVAATLQAVRGVGCPITVRGGSHSSLCAADQAVMIDLSAQGSAITVLPDEVVVSGGVTMGGLLGTLAGQSRLVPVGVARTPGMGLALQGGVGYLSRSLGLTLDQLRAVEIVVPAGEVLHLSEKSTGAEADLWWAVRGCAPNLGIVTSATFRTHTAPTRVFVQRLLLGLEAVPAFLEMAQALPRDTTASAVLGRPADSPDKPLLFLYIVHAGDGAEGMARVQDMTRELKRRVSKAPLLEHAGIMPYADMPPMDMPALSGFATWDQAPGERLFAFKKSPFLKLLDATAAARLVAAIRAAPTSACRIDVQHCGGAVADVAPTATAFWTRGFEWNCPIIGASFGRENKRDACTDWVRHTAQQLAAYTVGMYSVEILPGLAETATEVKQAFGGNLARLRELKKKWDPDQMLRLYYPL